MAYLIDQNFLGLLLAALFMGLAGWAWHARQSAGREQELERERARLLKEIVALTSGEAPAPGELAPADHDMEMLRMRADIASSRIAELERALDGQRLRADEAAERAAALEPAAAQVKVQADELARLRDQLQAMEGERLSFADTPTISQEAVSAQAWRLRYFEKRTAYLEDHARGDGALAAALIAPPSPPVLVSQPAPHPEPAPVAAPEVSAQRIDWRTRYLEARIKYLEDEVRAPAADPAPPPQPPAEPVAEAAPAQDALHWRMMYLEKRAAYLQGEAAALPAAKDEASALAGRLSASEQAAQAARAARAGAETEAERLKWRTRYLEARLRHFASLQAEAASMVEVEEAPVADAGTAPEETIAAAAPSPQVAPLVAPGLEVRPPALPAARNGAPDDFTLIEGVSPMQQSTLNSLGVYHFDQIAAWTPANVAWVDQYLRLRGRIIEEEWVEQAGELARGIGVARAERERELEEA